MPLFKVRKLLSHASLYHVITRRQPYQELGEDYFQHRDPAKRAQRLVRQLTHLGFEVQLLPQQSSASMPEALTLPASSWRATFSGE